MPSQVFLLMLQVYLHIKLRCFFAQQQIAQQLAARIGAGQRDLQRINRYVLRQSTDNGAELLKRKRIIRAALRCRFRLIGQIQLQAGDMHLPPEGQ